MWNPEIWIMILTLPPISAGSLIVIYFYDAKNTQDRWWLCEVGKDKWEN